MDIKRITAAASAFFIAFGMFASAMPVRTFAADEDTEPEISQTAEDEFPDTGDDEEEFEEQPEPEPVIIVTDRNGFMMAEDENFDKYVCGYVGAGGNITLPPDAVYVAKNAFAGNKNITGLTVPETCWKSIEGGAFAGCINLKKVTFEGNIEYIGEKAFLGCIRLKSVLFKGDVCESDYYGRYDGGGIFDSAFFGCRSLQSVQFKYSASKLSCIGTNAFANCLNLTTVRLPDKTPTIYGAFINCPKLKTVSIPLKTMIDKGSFGYMKDYRGYDDDPLVRADGRTTVSALYFTYDEASNTLKKKYVRIKPDPIVLTVVKGSDADKIADKYNIKHIAKLPAPSSVAVMGNNNGLIIMWPKVLEAEGYRVYKYNYSTGKYEKYADVTSPQLRIDNLSKDTIYKFKVAALNKTGGKYVVGELSKAAKFHDSHT